MCVFHGLDGESLLLVCLFCGEGDYKMSHHTVDLAFVSELNHIYIYIGKLLSQLFLCFH